MKFIYKLSLKMNECTYTFERDIVLACRRKKTNKNYDVDK